MKVITGLDRNTANAVIYGFDNTNIDYFRNKYNVLKSNLNHNTNDFTGFLQTLEYRNSDSYISDIKEKLYELGVAGGDEVEFYFYKAPSEANEITRQFIMANPFLTRLYDRGLIDGYSGNYTHNEFDTMDRFMSVTNGDEDEDGSDTFTTYYGHNEFNIKDDDKLLIKENWKQCMKLWKKDIDPTLQ